MPTNGDENILAFDPTTRRFSITTTNNHRADYNVVIRVTDSGLPLGKTNNAQAQPLNTYEYFRISVVEPPYESTARIDRLVETLNLPSATQNLPYTYTHVGELFDYVPDQFDDPSLTTDGLTIDCSGFLSCTRRRVNNQIEYHFEGTPQNQHVAQTSYTVTARAPWMETLSAQVQLNLETINVNDDPNASPSASFHCAIENADTWELDLRGPGERYPHFSDPDLAVDPQEVLSFSAEGDDAFEFNPDSLILNMTGPLAIGTYSTTVLVHDRLRSSARRDVSLKVVSAASLSIGAELNPMDPDSGAGYQNPEPTGTEDVDFSFDFPMHVFVSDTEDNRDFAFSVGNLPDWLDYQTLYQEPSAFGTTGVIRFSGRPGDDAVANSPETLTISATKCGVSIPPTAAMTITIDNENDPPVLINPDGSSNDGNVQLSAIEDQPFIRTLNEWFNDVDPNDTLEIQVTGLPYWLRYDAQTTILSSIEGEPSPNLRWQTVSFEVSATDETQATATVNVDLTVIPGNDPPYFTTQLPNSPFQLSAVQGQEMSVRFLNEWFDDPDISGIFPDGTEDPNAIDWGPNGEDTIERLTVRVTSKRRRRGVYLPSKLMHRGSRLTRRRSCFQVRQTINTSLKQIRSNCYSTSGILLGTKSNCLWNSPYKTSMIDQ